MLCSRFRDDSFAFGHERRKPGEFKGTSPQTHNAYEMILLNNCEVTYRAEEKSYQVKSNSLIFTPPGKLHSIQVDERWGYDRFNILFDTRAVNSEVLSQIPKDLDVFVFEEDTTVRSLFGKMEHYCRYFEGDALKSVLTDLTEQIIYELVIFIRKGKLKPNDHHTVNPTVAAAIEYIDSHLDMDFSLDMLCKELFVSKSYLHQLFIRHLQVSPWRYILGKRLMAAQMAIRAGERPTEIYSRFGFSEYSSFYRAYHKQFGYAPSEKNERHPILESEFL